MSESEKRAKIISLNIKPEDLVIQKPKPIFTEEELEFLKQDGGWRTVLAKCLDNFSDNHKNEGAELGSAPVALRVVRD